MCSCVHLDREKGVGVAQANGGVRWGVWWDGVMEELLGDRMLEILQGTLAYSAVCCAVLRGH